MALPTREVTEDGFERQFATNYHGPFALTGLRLPSIRQIAGSRVVTVSSSPDQMAFANSDALFSLGELAATIAREYEGQCDILCFGPYPSRDMVQAGFLQLRNVL
jgi:NAD(P)-dependent dehydrogenase (short-subunit alcohol dehydrogenase family)